LGEAVSTTTKLLMAIVFMAMTFLCVLLAGCTETGDKTSGNPSAKERVAGGASATNSGSPARGRLAGGTEVGEAFAEAELRPVGDSGVSGEVVFKEVGSLGVQVELEISGLPAPENPEEPEPYFAQEHGGSCSEAPKGGDHEHEEDRHTDDHPGHARQDGGGGPALALIHLERFLPGGREEYADHAEYEDPPADELPGNTDLPLLLVASANGTGMVTSLLEGVEPEQLTSGAPKYIDVRAPSHDAPEQWPVLACADLGEGGN
jgi:hypothetical protein